MNPACPTETDCICGTTPPTPTPIANAKPVIVTSSLSKGQVNKEYSAWIKGYDTDFDDNLSMNIVNLPPGITIKQCVASRSIIYSFVDFITGKTNTIDCQINGKPTTAGTYSSVKVTLLDGKSGITEKVYQIKIDKKKGSGGGKWWFRL